MLLHGVLLLPRLVRGCRPHAPGMATLPRAVEHVAVAQVHDPRLALPVLSVTNQVPPVTDMDALAAKMHAVAAQDLAKQEALRRKRVVVSESLVAAAAESGNLFEVLRAGLKTHLERDDADDLARATFAIVHDFDREHETSVRTDPTAIARIAEALTDFTASSQLNAGTTINLPFLSVTPSGPVHLQRSLNVQVYRELAVRPPEHRPKIALEPSPAATPTAAPQLDVPKKKKWIFF